jgi:hypothetical protein
MGVSLIGQGLILISLRSGICIILIKIGKIISYYSSRIKWVLKLKQLQKTQFRISKIQNRHGFYISNLFPKKALFGLFIENYWFEYE